MESLTIALIPVFSFIVWCYISYLARSFPTLVNKRILLLIAHPDDEAMFFAPCVQTLIHPNLGNQLKILCLSSGNADGLGEVRKKELMRSVTILGLTPADVILLEDDNLQDNAKPWNPQYISRKLLSSIVPNLSKTPLSKSPTASVDAIVTFDEEGVSQHPNHISCYRGAYSFLSDLMRGREGWESPVAVYALTSVNIFRKYASVFESLFAYFHCAVRIVWQRRGQKQTKNRRRDGRGSDMGSGTAGTANPNLLLFVSNPIAWNRAQRAMVFGHWSQMVWFRWGWIGLGRYLAVNDLVKVKPSV